MAKLFAEGRKQMTCPLLAAATSLTNGEQKGNLFCAVYYGPCAHQTTEVHLHRDSSETGAISVAFQMSLCTYIQGKKNHSIIKG